MPEELFLSPNEPNPNFMVYKDGARKIILKALGSKSSLFWLLGKTGIGKTTFLLWINQFAPLYKVKAIYFHGGEINFEDFKNKIEKELKASFFSRIFSKKKYSERPTIIMVDEIEHVKDENIFKYLLSKLDEGINISIIFSSVEFIDAIKEYFKEREIEKVYLEMPPLEELMEMIRKRIEAGGGEDFQPFGKQLVKDVIESSSTIREVLVKLGEALK